MAAPKKSRAVATKWLRILGALLALALIFGGVYWGTHVLNATRQAPSKQLPRSEQAGQQLNKTATNSSVSNRATTVPANQRITVTFGQHKLRAQLNTSSLATQLWRQLPLKLDFREFSSGFAEKIADLQRPLSIKGSPDAADPQTGDLAYWSPEPRVVLYWGDVGEYSGVHLLGHFIDRAAAAKVIEQQTGDFSAQIVAGWR
ncbi:cyclophilin-like fold protein [Lapidilactobacillus luobeiensis]|uniref:cyclophilin-like fold protein n=1 Tax=Lapidilactobacillus luobeiensis TaxID=2950371 RepID=UPI0021C2E374|nr:cyclophilin-like fold protein [Lapidilactobacillus luobeiensis]